MSPELITITFNQWKKWNPRKDIQNPSWFAMSNRITEDDQIQTLSDAEFRAFIHLFCIASQNNSPTVSINLKKAYRVTGIEIQVFLDAIEKLCAFGTCTQSDGSRTDDVRMPSVARTDDVQNPSATLQDKTIQNKTVQDTRAGARDESPPPTSKPIFSDAHRFENSSRFDFPRLYDLYPRPGRKSPSLKRMAEIVFSEEVYALLERSIRNYAEKCRIEKIELEYRLSLTTFLEEWRDYAEWTPPKEATETEDEKYERMAAEMNAELERSRGVGT